MVSFFVFTALMQKSKYRFAGKAVFRIATVLMASTILIPVLPAQPASSREPAATKASSAAPDIIDDLLGLMELTRKELAPDALSLLLRRGKPESAPPALTTRFLLRPLEAPYLAGQIAAQNRYWSHSPVRLLLGGVGRTPAEISRGYYGNPLSGFDRELDARAGRPRSPERVATAALHVGLDRLWGVAQNPRQDKAATLAELEALPPDWRRELGRLLYAIASALRWRELAFEDMPDIETDSREPWSPLRGILQRDLSQSHWQPDGHDPRPFIRRLNWDYLAAGALDLAVAAEDFEDFLASNPKPFALSATLATPHGWVILRPPGTNDMHGIAPDGAALGHALLLIDLGGDDVYTTGILASTPHPFRARPADPFNVPVQLIFDVEGNDRYIAPTSQQGSWGGAVGGYSFLFDRAGDDLYQGGIVSQGAGVLGIGMLVDRAGDDWYQALAVAQGCGYAGIGILHDVSGHDRFEAFARAQGCGDTLGAGLLLDEEGDDHYILNDTEILFPSAQTRAHNASMGQGMGLGLRADLSDGHSLPGGVGILHDRAGNDSYSAGVFAQGCGFLGGTGILFDDAGNDSYHAVYYAQGSAAHQAVGILVDGAGDDSYVTLRQCAQGSGHDFSLGWLLDLGGNDRYRAERLALGAANENGWGFLVDRGGNDSYEITAPPAAADALGAAKESKWGTPREDTPALGFFLDAGGNDLYKGVPHAGENQKWTYPRRYPELALKSERGVGADGEFPTVNLRTGPLTPLPESELREHAEQQAARRAYRKTE